jgi:DNA polymerase III epsilon subunit-like protein
MNKSILIVTDCETTGKVAGHNEIIQIAGKAYDPRTYEPIPDGEFLSLMRPEHEDRIEQEAMAVHKIPLEELRKAPEAKAVWLSFCNWVMRYNPTGSKWDSPIFCGKNIQAFDLKFYDVLKNKYGPKKEVWNSWRCVDLEHILFMWFNGNSELPNYKFDVVRDYLGLSKENGHDALVDCRQEGAVIMRFLQYHKKLFNPKKFRGSFKEQACGV